jgi:DNA mismatch repair protein MutS
MGDFYEMFEDDARVAARDLGLMLTSRNNGGAAEVPLAGVPVKAAAEYLRRLIAKGHRVAICEQTEDPKLAKGLVRREVVETVTPGTVLADEWLERNRNNYLAAVDPRGNEAGIAALDLITGQLILETVPTAELGPALERYEAAEVVLPQGTPLPRTDIPARTERDAWEFDAELARGDLSRAFDWRRSTGSESAPGTSLPSVQRARCCATHESSSPAAFLTSAVPQSCGAAMCCRWTR